MTILNRLFKVIFVLLICCTCNISNASYEFHKQRSPKNHPLAITSVNLQNFTLEEWQRISEFFTHKENTGARCVIRTDKEQRAGAYFIVQINKQITSLPKESRIKINFIKDNSFETITYEFDIDSKFDKYTSEVYCGVTHEVIDSKKILAWEVEILTKNNSVIASSQSPMWQKKKQKDK